MRSPGRRLALVLAAFSIAVEARVRLPSDRSTDVASGRRLGRFDRFVKLEMKTLIGPLSQHAYRLSPGDSIPTASPIHHAAAGGGRKKKEGGSRSKRSEAATGTASEPSSSSAGGASSASGPSEASGDSLLLEGYNTSSSSASRRSWGLAAAASALAGLALVALRRRREEERRRAAHGLTGSVKARIDRFGKFAGGGVERTTRRGRKGDGKKKRVVLQKEMFEDDREDEGAYRKETAGDGDRGGANDGYHMMV